MMAAWKMLFIEIGSLTFNPQGTCPTVPGDPGSVERDASAFEDARGQPAVKASLEVSSARRRAPRVQAPRLSKVPRLSPHPVWGDVA